MSQPIHQQVGLRPLQAKDFVLSALATKDGKRSTGQLSNDLKAYLPKERTHAAVEILIKDGYTADKSGRIALTKSGTDYVNTRFGKLPGTDAGRKYLENVVWPAVVLGLAPTSKGAARLRKGENLRAAALTVIFGLPLNKDDVTLASAISALLLRGIAGINSPYRPDDAFKSKLESVADLSQVDDLRKGIALLGLALDAEISGGSKKDVKREDRDDVDAFARRVQLVTDTLSTPPFSRKVAISQVYDAYGRKHPDAGGLETFKERVLNANASGKLRLFPLDEPSALDSDTRIRSLLETRHGCFHFIGRSAS